jgi:hypothetical protein
VVASGANAVAAAPASMARRDRCIMALSLDVGSARSA